MINKMKKSFVLACCFTIVLIISSNVLAQVPAGLCVGSITITNPPATPTLLLIDGDMCANFVNLDVILPGYPGVTKVEVRLKGNKDTFKSSAYPGVTLSVWGGSGDDTILIGGKAGSIFAQVDAYGDADNDNIAIEENSGQIVGGTGADLISSGESTTPGPSPTHTLVTGTLGAPSDGNVDMITCFDGPPSAPYIIDDSIPDGDVRVGC